jgi:hypothetical protein
MPALVFCFDAIPDAKPVATSAGIALDFGVCRAQQQ